MPPSNLPTRFGDRIRQLRVAKSWTQDQLAAAAGLHRTHVSLIERGKRSVRLETIEQLAAGLGADVAALFHVAPSAAGSDAEELERLLPDLRRFQLLASKHGIDDVFQDDGGKLLQTLIVLGLQKLPRREGNDAVDATGKEYELKTVNSLLTKSFSTHHHLNPTIIKKYREVEAWYFSVYENIELVGIYRIMPAVLEPFFKDWEKKWNKSKTDINNPKIPLSFVTANGTKVYPKSP